jgi:hypothetical protein
MNDYEAIRRLINAYADAIDRGEFERMTDLFARGTWRAHNGPRMNGNEFGESLRRRVILYEDGTPRTRHLLTNVDIEVDEDAGTAKAQTYGTIVQGATDGDLRWVSTFVYDDEFVRIEGQWHFAERWLHRSMVGDPSMHAPDLSSRALDGL